MSSTVSPTRFLDRFDFSSDSSAVPLPDRGACATPGALLGFVVSCSAFDSFGTFRNARRRQGFLLSTIFWPPSPTRTTSLSVNALIVQVD